MIPALEPTYQTTSQSFTGGLGKEAASFDQFLKLLLTQLQHQDPLNPMEAREFTAQLAQFSLLEQAIHTNEALETLKGYGASANQAQAIGLIGKMVKAQGDLLRVGSEGEIQELRFSLPETTVSTEVHLYDASGRLIRTVSLGPKEGGEQSSYWDGKDNRGSVVPPGTYRMEVVGKDAKGNPVTADPYIYGRAEAVEFGPNGTGVTVAGVPLSLDAIIEVRES